MNLAGVFKRYLTGRKTGQLVIKFRGEEHLCKVYIENGNAVYITLGKKNPDETIGYILDKEPLEADFIEGVPPLKKLDQSLNDKLLSLSGSKNESIKISGDIKVEGTVHALKVTALIDDFIDIVGPLGTVIAEKIISSLGYTKGKNMDGDDYSILLSSLLEEVPEEQRAEFKNSHT